MLTAVWGMMFAVLLGGATGVKTGLPAVTRLYQNHHLDSTRWERFQPREGDIVVATPYKSGTTWMQTIVRRLLFGERDVEMPSLGELSPWMDRRLSPLDAVIRDLEAQKHRRSVKTHIPLDGLPYFPQVKYVVVSRDARDVFMSLWNHYSNYTDLFYQMLNETPGRVGNPLPRCPSEARQLWHMWITTGWFEWDSEGFPFWSNMRHVQTWWSYRHLPNILFVHFNDLLRDLRGEVLRIARFLDIELDDESLKSTVDAVTFRAMKQDAERTWPRMDNVMSGGAQTFFHRGTNGRWEDVLTERDLKLYEAAVARELSEECARWLEGGRSASICGSDS